MADLSDILAAFRARVVAETSLTACREVDSLTRSTPDHLVPKQFVVWSPSTRSRGGRAGDSLKSFDDTVTVEIADRVLTDQVGSLATVLATSKAVRVALTNLTWFQTNSMQCVEYVSEARQRREGWLIITQTYRVTRQAVLG